MQITLVEGAWAIGLQSREEARALLAVHATHIGTQVLASLDTARNHVEPPTNAIKRLQFAEHVLPEELEAREGTAPETVEFPVDESQHLSGLMYAAALHARNNGEPITDYDDWLVGMESQVEAFFEKDKRSV